jgi:hypothetical protein
MEEYWNIFCSINRNGTEAGKEREENGMSSEVWTSLIAYTMKPRRRIRKRGRYINGGNHSPTFSLLSFFKK